MNQLYYGDNLDVLRRYIANESVDLVYLDPPFNSNASYNVLFAEGDGTRAASQIKAFEDTWEWNEDAARSFEEVVEGGGRPSEAMQAFRTLLNESNMMAYLSMMAPRLIELKRVLKPTGSLFLHCDPTASHYLKLLLDAILGPEQFANEIIWVRSLPHGNISKKFGASHDVILFYRRGERATWNGAFQAHRPEYLEQFYKHRESNGRVYRLISCINPNPDRPNLTYDWNGVTRVWKYTRERMKKMHDAGLLVYSKNGIPSYKGYLDQMKGTPMQDVWTDIPPLMGVAQERLGYPTQKPEALLERIIKATTCNDAVVLDPFCGCGTTIAAAQKLGRKWIGIDITHLAISLIRSRLTDSFTSLNFEVIGEPVSLPDASQLAHDDPYQFQWWALGLVGARPVEQKRGADKGIDGRIYFHGEDGKTKQIVLSVKAGKLHAPYVRDLRGVMERERAEIAVLISLEEPTAPMRREAAAAGFYTSHWGEKPRKIPRLQLLTIEDLLTGHTIDRPPSHTLATFKRAPKHVSAAEKSLRLQLDGEVDEDDVDAVF